MTHQDHASPQQPNEPRDATTRTPASLHEPSLHPTASGAPGDRPQPSTAGAGPESGKAEDMIAAMAERMWGDDAPRDAQR